MRTTKLLALAASLLIFVSGAFTAEVTREEADRELDELSKVIGSKHRLSVTKWDDDATPDKIKRVAGLGYEVIASVLDRRADLRDCKHSTEPSLVILFDVDPAQTLRWFAQYAERNHDKPEAICEMIGWVNYLLKTKVPWKEKALFLESFLNDKRIGRIYHPPDPGLDYLKDQRTRICDAALLWLNDEIPAEYKMPNYFFAQEEIRMKYDKSQITEAEQWIQLDKLIADYSEKISPLIHAKQ